jgi:hypothetical protein
MLLAHFAAGEALAQLALPVSDLSGFVTGSIVMADGGYRVI